MRENTNPPLALKIVAYISILSGVESALSMVIALLGSKIKLDFGIIGIFVGLGLLRGSLKWRNWALIFVYFQIFVIFLFTIFSISQPHKIFFKVFGVKVGRMPLELALFFVLGLAAFIFWEYSVLKRKDVIEYCNKID
jgi:hypothetical protein